MYDCSYCSDLARYVGKGQDGDFYCKAHIHRAPGEVESIQENILSRSQLQAEQLYFVEKSRVYAVSPDGVGIYWYDTEEEVFEQHGDLGPTIFVDDITDF